MMFIAQEIFPQNWKEWQPDSLSMAIRRDNKPYKIIYVFCTWCKSSCTIENYAIDKLIAEHNSDSISYWPICGDSQEEAYDYIKGYNFCIPINMIKFAQTKRHGIITTNAAALTSNYIRDNFDKEADKLGSGGYIILNRNNKPIKRSDYSLNYKYIKSRKEDHDFSSLVDFVVTH